MSMLTAEMLRGAAAHLWPNHDHVRLEFMCRALEEHLKRHFVDLLYEGLSDFRDLLWEHDVSTGGMLRHRGRSYYYREADDFDAHLPAAQVQAHRFDFLNLLACELENP